MTQASMISLHLCILYGGTMRGTQTWLNIGCKGGGQRKLPHVALMFF